MKVVDAPPQNAPAFVASAPERDGAAAAGNPADTAYLMDVSMWSWAGGSRHWLNRLCNGSSGKMA